MKAWQPILTPKWVIATFAILGLVFVPIGIAIISISSGVVEVIQRYDDVCGEPTSACSITVNIDQDMAAPVYFYYQLTNFFQNHRRYVKSRSDAQLRGIGDLAQGDYDDCLPVVTSEAPGAENSGVKLYPCGLIANSFFNGMCHVLFITHRNRLLYHRMATSYTKTL